MPYCREPRRRAGGERVLPHRRSPRNALEAAVGNSHIHAIMLTNVLIRVQTVSPAAQDVLNPQLDSGADVPD